MKSSIRQARAAFQEFKGEKPGRVRVSRLPRDDVAGWELGPMIGVAYQARRDGETLDYFHEFKKSARPRLVAAGDGRQLYIDGGAYKVMPDRGIVDMPNLFVVNPDRRKGKTMARRLRRRRRSHAAIFTSNPRRRRRARPSRSRITVYARNPRRRRRRSHASAARRIYRRNPARRARAPMRRRRYRRNPSAGVGKLSSLIWPAVFIGLGGVATEVACAYLPIPIAWKQGPMRYVVKGAVGVGVGLVIAKALKQKRLGYYFAAGAVAIATYDMVKHWLNASAPAIKGLGYINPATVARFGQYQRALPMNRFGQYTRPLRSQFGGAATITNARQPGGEMNFAA